GASRRCGVQRTPRPRDRLVARAPLLANLYMNRFLKHWRGTARGEIYRAHVVNYADAILPMAASWKPWVLASAERNPSSASDRS
ncbi:MAG: hypothetical protein J2P48_14975, partial [Alphaproteobacteria bacterium]|nr:hypothetical protein [Alphaproteobacteria bacterium]